METNIYSARLEVKGGRGGDGLVSFCHYPGKPKGGPDGGNGGNGGNIIIKTNNKYHSLEHLYHEYHVKAENGKKGGSNKKHGRNGKDRIIYVPSGTTIFDAEKNEIIVDLKRKNEKITVARGGKGGRGNSNFATSTNQAPRTYTPGLEGETARIYMEFSPLIDVAVIGPPNSGKSSIVAALTGGNPIIKNYPYTTIKAHLWVYTDDINRYTFLDTPPLAPEYIDIIKILIKRAGIIVLVLEAGSPDIKEALRIVEEELISNSEDNNKKTIVTVINKIERKEDTVKIASHPTFPVSVKLNKGVELLKSYLIDTIKNDK